MGWEGRLFLVAIFTLLSLLVGQFVARVDACINNSINHILAALERDGQIVVICYKLVIEMYRPEIRHERGKRSAPQGPG